MSMISEQVNKIRKVAKCVCLATDKEVADDISSTLNQAADTIEALAAKLAAANMERSDRYYGNETNLKKFKEWIANSNIEQIAEYLLHEYDGILYTSDGTDFDDTKKLEAINYEIEWLNAKYDEEYWNMW